MNTDKLNQAVSQAQQKAEGFTPKSAPKTNNQAPTNPSNSVAQTIHEAREFGDSAEALEFKDAIIAGSAKGKRWLGVYAATFETVIEHGAAQYHARRTSENAGKGNNDNVDVKALIKQHTGIDVDANAENLGKQIEASAQQIMLPSTPQLYLLPSIE